MSLLYDKIYACLCGGIIGDAMGAPAEGMHYREIAEKLGWIDDFRGAGTDDSAIRQILIDALLKHEGHVTADEWGKAFLQNPQHYPLFYIPVRNMYHKLEAKLAKPVEAGRGNMQSSSSAMSISPMGIVNACDPRRAAAEAWDAAGLIHGGATNFCRDGACAIAAAVAEAFRPEATTDSVVKAAWAYLHPDSAMEMIGEIKRTLALAVEKGSYEAFREAFYNVRLREVISDSRETVPCALALFWLAEGNGSRTVEYAANFGRDADTIGTMAGAICGAFGGRQAFPAAWIEALEHSFGHQVSVSKDEYDCEAQTMRDQREVATALEALIKKRIEFSHQYLIEMAAMNKDMQGKA